MKILTDITVGGKTIPITPGTQADFTDLGSIFTRLLQYLLPLAGLILFAMIIISGFKMLTSAGNPKSIDSAKQRLTWSIVGFLILFVAFWIMRMLEFLLGITIL
jgi:hypothetical protein